MKKKMIVGVLVCLTVCALVFAADSNFKVTKTCIHCGAEKTATITAVTQKAAETKGKKSIIVTHNKDCMVLNGKHTPNHPDHFTIYSYEDNCCPVY